MTPIRTRGGRLPCKVTTGCNLFAEGGDGRTVWARRWNNLIFAHASGLGGSEVLSEAQISICRRAAATEVALEQLEARMSEGQKIDLDQYGRLSSRLYRILELVGIRRMTKNDRDKETRR
jgi:hypothetical protein